MSSGSRLMSRNYVPRVRGRRRYKSRSSGGRYFVHMRKGDDDDGSVWPESLDETKLEGGEVERNQGSTRRRGEKFEEY